ncbi:MAG: imidazoleglycerol-phosphate dehydratase HisB [Actinobacteria bacterium]|nr:imidazoleglycerol-phosphate dehydratase HisB [Actinomycetota bacterium]MCL5447509.1 imidazoleglycerol-phosphate dehydratase HisB [Actinomycetota bacterium]
MVSDRTANDRAATVKRETSETAVAASINLDGSGRSEVATGIPFFDHMLAQLGRHSSFDLHVTASGDLAVDTHHTVEDVGIALGESFAQAAGAKAGMRRFASLALPLDEALVEVALDLSGRPYLAWGISFPVDIPGIGEPPFYPQLAEEFFRAFVTAAKITVHVWAERWSNPHHVLEASFKALARCLHDATKVEGDMVPSTKGVL